MAWQLPYILQYCCASVKNYRIFNSNNLLEKKFYNMLFLQNFHYKWNLTILLQIQHLLIIEKMDNGF